MTPEEALVNLGRSTAEAISGVLEVFCPGEVAIGGVSALPQGAEPLAGFPAPFVAASVSYAGGVTGGNVLAISVLGARRLAAAMMGAEPPGADGVDTLTELELSAVSEAMNQMMAAAAGATSSVLGTEVDISPPQTRLVAAGGSTDDLCPSSPHVASSSLRVLGESCRLVQLVPNSFTVRMTRALDDLGDEVRVEAAAAVDGSEPLVGGITMRLSVELGRVRMPAGRAVSLASGEIVELDADVDAPIDLLVNGVPFATGRLLVTDYGDWAVQVDQLIPASEVQIENQGDSSTWPVYSS